MTDYDALMTTTSEPTTADDFTTEIAPETTDMLDTTKEVIEPEVNTTPQPSSPTTLTTTTTSTTTTTTTSEKIPTTSTRFQPIVTNSPYHIDHIILSI